MFGNNNQKTDVNVSTTITTLFSEDSSLTISCWNDQLSLRWMLPIGKTESGHTTYDKTNPLMTSLSLTKETALYQAYNKKLRDKILNGVSPEEDDNVGVEMTAKDGSRAIVLIEYLSDENGIASTYLTIYKIPVGGTIESARKARFKFNKTTIITGFNPATGESKGQLAEDGELGLFIDIMKNRVLTTKMNLHAKRYSDAFRKMNQPETGGAQNPMSNNMGGGVPGGFQPNMGFNSSDFGVFS